MAAQTVLGVIGGSGIYSIPGLEITAEHEIETPFGKPSDAVAEAKVNGKKIFFLPRHGKHHSLLPSEVPYQANIWALKSLGVSHALAVSAVGIMQEEIKPGDFVVPDQIFDRTKSLRPSTFFGRGLVGHVAFADPFCEDFRKVAISAARNIGATVHGGGAYVCMEGPQFSTRAESHFYRKTLSPSVIGMTAVPEAKLAREAEISYAMIATGTDYDCWHESEGDVDVESVLKVLKENAEKARKAVFEVHKILPSSTDWPSQSAAKFALITPAEQIPSKTKKDLGILYDKYWNSSSS